MLSELDKSLKKLKKARHSQLTIVKITKRCQKKKETAWKKQNKISYIDPHNPIVCLHT